MNIKALKSIETHSVENHQQHKKTYQVFIQNYVEYRNKQIVDKALIARYVDVFEHCDICADYYTFFQAHFEILNTSEKQAAFFDRSTNDVLAEVQLAAAAAKNIKDWFSEVIHFAGISFDIRTLGTQKNAISITLKPSGESDEEIKKRLASYAGKTVDLVIMNNHQAILKANIDVAADASCADGEGIIIDSGHDLSNKTIHIEIITKILRN